MPTIKIAKAGTNYMGTVIPVGAVYGHFNATDTQPRLRFYVPDPRRQAERANGFFVMVWRGTHFRREYVATIRGWSGAVFRFLVDNYNDLQDTKPVLTRNQIAKVAHVDTRKTRPYTIYGRTDCYGSGFLRRVAGREVVTDTPGHKGKPELYWSDMGAFVNVLD